MSNSVAYFVVLYEIERTKQRMKSILKVYFTLIFQLVLVVISVDAKAGVAGGELVYTWLHDSTYQVMLKYYVDCKGTGAPSSMTLCIKNNCTNVSFSTVMSLWGGSVTNNRANGSEVPLGCSPHDPTDCTDPNAKLPGYKEWWYVDTLTLPARCSNWKFSVSGGARGVSDNLNTSNFYVEATLNNQLSHQNSSPGFNSIPLIFVCRAQPYTYRHNGSDTDGDSLRYSTVPVQTVANINCPPANLNAGVKQLTPPINYINNPFQTNNTYAFDSSSGVTDFTSVSIDNGLFAVNVDEYRNGAKIGSVLRSLCITNIICSTSISGGGIIDSVKGGDTSVYSILYCCVGQQVDYWFSIYSGDTVSRFYLEDSISKHIPGAQISYSDQYDDTVRVHFTWTPTLADVGSNSFRLLIHDSGCRPPGNFYTYATTFDVYVGGSVFAGKDTAICAHESIKLTPSGGLYSGPYTWEMLPGSTGTLSCNQCVTAYGRPAPNASYVVTSSASWCPDVYTDTINVTLLNTSVTYPSINISVSPGGKVWQWLESTFTATVSNCNNPELQWTLNGKDIPGATANTWSSTTLIDGDIISCRLTCKDTCPSPRDTISNKVDMDVAMSVREVATLTTEVYPNPNNGRFTLTIDGFSERLLPISITDVLGNIVHQVKAGELTFIDISDKPSGVYFVEITDGNNVVRKRVVIFD